jgi:hypothetical protein
MRTVLSVYSSFCHPISGAHGHVLLNFSDISQIILLVAKKICFFLLACNFYSLIAFEDIAFEICYSEKCNLCKETYA